MKTRMSEIGLNTVFSCRVPVEIFYLETSKEAFSRCRLVQARKFTSPVIEIYRGRRPDAILITHEHSDHIHGSRLAAAWRSLCQ